MFRMQLTTSEPPKGVSLAFPQADNEPRGRGMALVDEVKTLTHDKVWEYFEQLA